MTRAFAALALLLTACPATSDSLLDELAGVADGYPIVDTNQHLVCDDAGVPLEGPEPGDRFYGQDAQHEGNAPAYADHGDGTVTDLVTGLMWQQDPGAKTSLDAALDGAASFDLAGYDDWRVPSLKELYSLMDFSGSTGHSEQTAVPYLDVSVFDFDYGDTSQGERYIDAQFLSSTEYVSTTMNGDDTVFGVNFADGRIKGYPVTQPGNAGEPQLMSNRYVRGNADYGRNAFVDQGDGTIADEATGLTWMQQDSGEDGGLDWEQALLWCEQAELAGGGWRLPNAKELQSLVDYTGSPDTTGSAAIDPLFDTSSFTDGLGQADYPYFWSSTTHLDGANPGDYAVYVAFGEAQGFMETPPGSGDMNLLDVHGAGAQRSDPKSGDPADYPTGHGPQGDVIRIYNHARCVR